MARTQILLPAGVVLLGLTLTGCSSSRSVENYCETFYGEGSILRERFSSMDAESDPLGSFATALSAPQELATFFTKLEEVSPEEIAPDVAVLRDTFQDQADSLGDTATNPLGGLVGGLVGGLSASGSYERVDRYTMDNCGPPPS